MPAYKNQHFVPKCLLRQFSPDQDGRRLNVLNIRSTRLIANAPLKNQASKNYMYGRDGELESLLARLEGLFAACMRRVRDGAETEEDLRTLRLFMYVQYRRTEMAVQRLKLSYDVMNQTIFDNAEDAPPVPGAYELIIHSLKYCFDTMKFIDDLKIRIVENRTNVDFIVSDDPVIFCNKFAHQKLQNAGFGVSSSGIFFLMPLSPRHALMCYDGLVYTLPELENGRLIVKRREDALSMNEFQSLKAAENIYFRDWAARDVVRAELERVAANREENWSEITVWVRDDNGPTALRNDDGVMERYRIGTREEGRQAGMALMQYSFKQPIPERWPLALKYRSKPKTFYNGTGVGHVRKQEWLREVL